MNFNEKQITMIFLIFLVIISILPEMASSYFVHTTGKIKIIGLGLGLLTASSIFYKWKYAKQLFYSIFVLTLLGDIFIILQNQIEFRTCFIILILLHLGLIIFFTVSKNIKSYLSELK